MNYQISQHEGDPWVDVACVREVYPSAIIQQGQPMFFLKCHHGHATSHWLEFVRAGTVHYVPPGMWRVKPETGSEQIRPYVAERVKCGFATLTEMANLDPPMNGNEYRALIPAWGNWALGAIIHMALARLGDKYNAVLPVRLVPFYSVMREVASCIQGKIDVSNARGYRQLLHNDLRDAMAEIQHDLRAMADLPELAEEAARRLLLLAAERGHL